MASLIVSLIALVLVPTLHPEAAPPRQGAFNADKALRASVYVMQVYDNSQNSTVISCVGSGMRSRVRPLPMP